jgi:hypothetical protein
LHLSFLPVTPAEAGVPLPSRKAGFPLSRE